MRFLNLGCTGADEKNYTEFEWATRHTRAMN
jgi:hypothetical protein